MEVTFSGGTGIPTYQWYSNSSDSNTGGTIISGETDAKFTPSVFSTVGNFYFYSEISIEGNGCSLATSDAFEVIVLTDPVIDTQALAAQELCQSATPDNLTISVSGGTTTDKTYQWYENTTNSSNGGTEIIGADSDTYTPSTTNVGTIYYYVIVSQSESGCSVTSDTSEVKVNEAPKITSHPVSTEVCLDGTVTLLEVDYENGTGSATYQWFSNTSDDRSTGTPIPGETSKTYQPLSDVVGTTYYYVEISFTTGGCLQIVSNTASVIINEIPVIDFAEVTIYSEGTFIFDPKIVSSNTIPEGTEYIWSTPTFNPAGSIIGSSAETTSQEQISQTLENTGTTPVIVTYIITPTTIKCTGDSFVLEVTVNPNVNSNAVIINNSCFESNDGAISTNIIGGIPFDTGNPYLINWIGPNGFSATDANITDLEAGIYTLKIEDKNGYSITENHTVTEPNLLTITKDLVKNISCFQGNDGEIDVTIDGGTLPYIYNWSTLDGSGIVPNVEIQNTLTAGSYTLEIIDKNNCTTSIDITLTEPEGLKIEALNLQDILCFGDATGEIEVDVSGGTPLEISVGIFDYLYDWSGPNGYMSTSKNIDNLISGTYKVAVTDNFGCTTNAEFILRQPTEVDITYTKTDVTCYGLTNGAIDVNVTGGKEPYQISWSNLSNGFSLSNLSADTYVATVTDANNCVKQVSIIIDQPIFFIDPVVKPISCNGENDGSIDLNLTGGVAPFKVTWSDDTTAGIQRNNLSPGTYSVKIVDSDIYQCPIEQTFVFTDPPAIGVSTTVIDAIDCDVVNSGSIDLEISGGTVPYSFLWNTNQTTEDLENIPPGDYSVEITDANGCSIIKQFNIFRQEPLAIALEETTITDCFLKTVSKQNTAIVTGGYLPYTYTWSDGLVSGIRDKIMTTTQTGSYILTITDGKGCEKSKSFFVDLPIIGDVDFRYNAFALSTYDLLSIEDPIQFTNLSTGDYTSLKWDFGDGTISSNEENPTHTYDQIGDFKVVLTVEFTAGCIEVFERIINITQGYSLIHPTAFTPNRDGYNETIRPSYLGFTELKMMIYDTWGTVVYSEEGLNIKGWNGLIGDKPAENGNYIMVVNGMTFYQKEITKSSPIILLK
jgi:gliding motility-associated-like protein